MRISVATGALCHLTAPVSSAPKAPNHPFSRTIRGLKSLMDSVRSALSTLALWLAWLPRPLVAIVIVALAVVIALSLHKTVRRVLRLTLASRYPSVLAVVQQMRGVTRLGLIVLALIVALPVAPFDPNT